jgi:ribosomal protein S18 acetylase RimI-like enzyme
VNANVAPYAVRRLAEQSRIAELHALTQAALGALAIDPPSSVRKETVADFAARLAREVVLVAEAERRLIGGVFCAPQEDAFYVGRLAVVSDWRRRGVASALIDAAQAEARTAGAARITLKVRIALPDNVALFRRHGFVVTAEETHAGYSAPTSYAMELRL